MTDTRGCGSNPVVPYKPSDFVFVDRGTFTMGDIATAPHRPPHTVTLTEDYFILKSQVTACLYDIYEDTTRDGSSPVFQVFFSRDLANAPRGIVNWESARNFCRWIGGSLPTEAQWERAAKRDDPLWKSRRTGCNAERRSPRDVCRLKGEYPSWNGEEICDMGDNMQEWVLDDYTTLPQDNATDPLVSSPCRKIGPKPPKVIKGRIHWDTDDGTRIQPATLAEATTSQMPDWYIGFRCVLTVSAGLRLYGLQPPQTKSSSLTPSR